MVVDKEFVELRNRLYEVEVDIAEADLYGDPASVVEPLYSRKAEIEAAMAKIDPDWAAKEEAEIERIYHEHKVRGE